MRTHVYNFASCDKILKFISDIPGANDREIAEQFLITHGSVRQIIDPRVRIGQLIISGVYIDGVRKNCYEINPKWINTQMFAQSVFGDSVIFSAEDFQKKFGREFGHPSIVPRKTAFREFSSRSTGHEIRGVGIFRLRKDGADR